MSEWIERTDGNLTFWHRGTYRIMRKGNVFSATCAADRIFSAFCSSLEQAKAIVSAHRAQGRE